MPKKIKLTPAEWEIMNAVWDLEPPVSVREVLEHRYPRGEKAYTTVQTVMNTLEKKGLLSRRKTGLVNFYSATRSRDEATKAEMSTLVTRVFGGSIPELASALMSLDDLDLAEVEQIKALLARKESELKGGGS
jgi:predicted transcriptional regulator